MEKDVDFVGGGPVTNTLASAAGPGAKKVPKAELILAVRRLDWRFLLPNPRLGRVGYIGKEGTSLAWSLEHFSETFIRVVPGEQGRQLAVDLLVCEEQADRVTVAEAARRLAPGACLYCEITKPRLLSLNSGISRFLRKMGYGEIEIYWARPGFENCLELVPVKEKSALKFLFSRNLAGVKGRMISLAGTLLSHMGLAALCCRRLSVVARKGL